MSEPAIAAVTPPEPALPVLEAPLTATRPAKPSRSTRTQSAFSHAVAPPAEPGPAPTAVASPPAPVPTVTSSEPPPPGADQTHTPPDDSTLLTDAEFASLQSEHSDPVALRKALETRFNKAFTPRMQKLSALTKALAPHADLLDGLESPDPAIRQATVRQLAQTHGLTLAEPGPSTETPYAASADALTITRQALGPELEFLAEKIAPAFEQLLDRRVKPIEAARETAIRQQAEREVRDNLATFAAKHPNWKTHEAEMIALAQRFQPAGDQTEADWMESLYRLVTYDSSIAAGVQAEIQKMSKAAKASTETRPAAASASVHRCPPPGAGWREAVAAAQSGVIWE